MVGWTGLWKAILFTAFAAVLTHGTPASALVTQTFKWDPPDYGDVAGYYVYIDSGDNPVYHKTVLGQNWATVTAAPNETITVSVTATPLVGTP